VLNKQREKALVTGTNPLLISVRSGSVFSMPGMMDTVLNLGLNDKTVVGLAKQTANERFAKDAYRRFCNFMGQLCWECRKKFLPTNLTRLKSDPAKTIPIFLLLLLRKLLLPSKNYQKHTKSEFPQDPYKQLHGAIAAVFNSWNGERARIYREINKIPHDLGTAVNIWRWFWQHGRDVRNGRCLY